MVTPLSMVNNLLMVGFTVSVTISALSQSWFCATVKVRFSCLWPLVLQNRCTDMETGGFNWLWSCCGCCLTGMCTCEESEKNWWEMLFTFIYLLMIFLFKYWCCFSYTKLRIRKNYFKCKLYQGFSTFIFTKKNSSLFSGFA